MHHSYRMRDQVRGCVPSIMEFDVTARAPRRQRVFELVLFVAAMITYLGVLTFSA